VLAILVVERRWILVVGRVVKEDAGDAVVVTVDAATAVAQGIVVISVLDVEQWIRVVGVRETPGRKVGGQGLVEKEVVGGVSGIQEHEGSEGGYCLPRWA